jgi:outer membrane biosynthesis protein TonB
MQITLDTNDLSDVDRQILGLLAGGTFVLGEAAETFDEEQEYEPEPEVEEEPEPTPAPKARRTRKAPEPEPEPEPEVEEEPEPAAEEPLEEEEPVEDEDEDAEVDDDMSDEDLLALAVKKATEMVGGGQAAAVREALDAAGASRVRELNADNVREFFKALG